MLHQHVLTALGKSVHFNGTYLIHRDPRDTDANSYYAEITSYRTIPSTSIQPGASKVDQKQQSDFELESESELEKTENDSANCAITFDGWISFSLRIKYEIIYSAAFSTPVLYFDAYFQDQLIVDIDYVLRLISPDYHPPHNNIDDFGSLQNMITQTMHPLTNLPCFFIHPCQMASVMKQLGLDDQVTLEYLTLWINTYGPVVGLYCV
ncbi:hypothetical protein NADFUDRAFT_48998 [Nadsonia fulvescens var. elongata DSM 6958]|uniref:Ubiquitin-like-conjugating enzyme ATG10 n=1 Tax=Nadsonia fulvescens var. elongata DSM 6958 TaxID=857566 RepID=A0A1E3PSE9_9ASCO|nr:hypothetical protein NADFUDRAFT_48998 [Nadsonia fulvescens var. elongata DSM 6958]